VTTKCAVGVKLNGKIAVKFIINTVKKMLENMMLVVLAFFSLIWAISLKTNNIDILITVSILVCIKKVLILLIVMNANGAVNHLADK
jgi:hypothetical protein